MFTRSTSGPTRLAAVAGALCVTLLGIAGAASPAGSAAAAGESCTPQQFYVARSGDDAADGSKAHPWRTIDHARDQIRTTGANSAGTMTCDIDVNVRAGDYPVKNTLDFDQRDSGTGGHRVIYRSIDGPGKARLLGAQQVKGWKQWKGNIYRTKVSGDFHTLFEGDQRATTARFPNRTKTETLGPYLQAAESDDDALTNSQTWMAFNDGEWKKDWDLHDAQVVIWSGGHWTWFTDTDPVDSVNWDKGFVTLKYPTRYALFSRVGSRYFIQNSLDFLDSPGEYYHDSKTGWLYYWPKNGSISASTPIWAPTVKTVLNVAGADKADRAHDLIFDGFSLEYSDFVDWYRYGWNAGGDSGVPHKYPEYDRQIEMPRNRFGAITLTNTRRVTLRNLNISNTGFHSIYLLFANDHDTIRNNLIAHSGANGIKLEGGYPGEGDVSHDNKILNNYISWVGDLDPGDAAGIDLVSSGNNTVRHAVIMHSARYALALKSITTTPNKDNYEGGNQISFVKIAHAGKDSGDMGAIDAYGVQNRDPITINTPLNQITVDDVNADPSMPDVVPSGVHMDSGGCGLSFTNIEVTNVQYDPPFHGNAKCNVFGNVSWKDGFDAEQMQYDQIGVTKQFPYADQAASVG